MSGLVQPIVAPGLAPPRKIVNDKSGASGFQILSLGSTPIGEEFFVTTAVNPSTYALSANLVGPGVVTGVVVAKSNDNDVGIKSKIEVDGVVVFETGTSATPGSATTGWRGFTLIDEEIPFAKSFKVYTQVLVASNANELKSQVAYRLT